MRCRPASPFSTNAAGAANARFAASTTKVECTMALAAATLIDRIDALLPQTQCRRCGHDACRPYAEAIAVGSERINRCPPGGEPTIVALAALLGVPVEPLDPARGAQGEFALARIDEAACIGCTLCIEACPVDAIVGAAKRMHTVLASHCAGCELCVPACPVDCIAMVPAGRRWTREDADRARARHRERQQRLARRRTSLEVGAGDAYRAERRAAITAAFARARARRAKAGFE